MNPHHSLFPTTPARHHIEQAWLSFSKSSGRGSRRQKRPEFMQHFLNRFPDPQGQRSFLPSFSESSLFPRTIRTPRFTFFSEANPLRRLLIVSKKMAAVHSFADP
jgi:hypothetical protein